MAYARQKFFTEYIPSLINRMKKQALLLLSICSLFQHSVSGQFISGFETQPIDSSLGYYAGAAGSNGFTDNGIFFRNDYNATFGSWNGFALSRKTDSVTAGYNNQYSCRAGNAFEGSTFALAYASSRIFIRKEASTETRRLKSFRFTNSTYAARSMETGDAFAKKFGGASGLDPDFFVLKVYNYLNGNISDSTAFYLADYRAEGSQNDYIITGWNLAETGFTLPFDSLGFELQSSDIGSFGMNTPAYFCMDNLETEAVSSVKERNTTGISLYPNPASGSLYLKLAKEADYRITDLTGRLLIKGNATEGVTKIDISSIPPGCYQLGTGSSVYRFLIQ